MASDATSIPHLRTPAIVKDVVPQIKSERIVAPQDRLFIGNLHPSVDEHALFTMLKPYGTIVGLNFLYHTAGAFKGSPRGYAFVKYSTVEETELARARLQGKTVRGRQLSIGYANQPEQQDDSAGVVRRSNVKVGRKEMTTLSLLKGGQSKDSSKSQTSNQIQALEAKLKQMGETTAEPSNRAIHPLPDRPVTVLTTPTSQTEQLEEPVLLPVDRTEKAKKVQIRKPVIKGVKILKKSSKPTDL